MILGIPAGHRHGSAHRISAVHKEVLSSARGVFGIMSDEALEPRTVIPFHRHHASSGTVVTLRGKIEWVFYDDSGNEVE